MLVIIINYRALMNDKISVILIEKNSKNFTDQCQEIIKKKKQKYLSNIFLLEKVHLKFHKNIISSFLCAFYRILRVYIAIYYTYTLYTHGIEGRETRVHTYANIYIYTHTHTLANLKHEVANFNSEKEQ